MADSSTPLTGPDFAQGISVETIADGEKLLGHAFGDPVLLTRIGSQYFAIGATCSHYGGPLAEGVIVGDTVRCPWHHACFSLRNGEALRAPALNSIPSYQVERRDGHVLVTKKVERQPLAPTYPMAKRGDAPKRVVIIG